MNDYSVINYGNSIIINENDNMLKIEKINDSLLFYPSKDNLKLEINYFSLVKEEWESYIIFENFMKSVIGKYILDGDSDNIYNALPEDFINLKTKTITIHSFSEEDAILKIEYQDKKIVISLKSKHIDENNGIVLPLEVADYGNYYREFEKLFFDFYDILNKNKYLDLDQGYVIKKNI